MLKGVSLVVGEWLGSDHSFQNEPISGVPDSFAAGGGTPELVNWACEAAEEAFWTVLSCVDVYGPRLFATPF